MNKIEHIPAEITDVPEQRRLMKLEQRVLYAHTQCARGVPLDTINALHVFSFPALPLVGHRKECMNCIYAMLNTVQQQKETGAFVTHYHC